MNGTDEEPCALIARARFCEGYGAVRRRLLDHGFAQLLPCELVLGEWKSGLLGQAPSHRPFRRTLYDRNKDFTLEGGREGCRQEIAEALKEITETVLNVIFIGNEVFSAARSARTFSFRGTV